MMLAFDFLIRNAGLPCPGLLPTFIAFRRSGFGSDMMKYRPMVNPLGDGMYSFTWDSELGGDVAGIIDAGVEVVDPNERFSFHYPTRESGRVLGLPYPPAVPPAHP